MTGEAPRIAIADWGSTRLRIWLLSGDGRVVGEKRGDDGMLAAQPDRFASVLEAYLAALGAPADLPVVICGMAGARQGWIEAPYATVPAAPGDIFGASVRVPGLARDVRIVPGLAQRDDGSPDVLRGEETQLAGAGLECGRHVVCMPGTHSKWAELSEGAVLRFQTFMTGELFSVLSKHSILVHSTGPETEAVAAGDPVFAAWFRQAMAEPATVTGQLFRIRAGSLLAGLSQGQAAAALSGLLIGAEFAGATALFGRINGPLTLVASGAMGDIYSSAARLAELDCRIVDADEAVRRGLSAAAALLHPASGALR